LTFPARPCSGHGSALEAEFEEAMADARRTRALARAARESGGDEDGSLMSAAASILQDNLLRVSLAVKRDSEDDPAAAAKTLSLISRAFADVGRMDIANQKWMAETRTKLAAMEARPAAAIAGGWTRKPCGLCGKRFMGPESHG
jgi:hypothetical protein